MLVAINKNFFKFTVSYAQTGNAFLLELKLDIPLTLSYLFTYCIDIVRGILLTP